MDDGTMVVIENGQRYLNQQINVIVTKVITDSRRPHDLCQTGRAVYSGQE
jgi:uncharacterized protein YacL